MNHDSLLLSRSLREPCGVVFDGIETDALTCGAAFHPLRFLLWTLVMHFAGHSSSSTRDDAPVSSSLPPSRSEATISDVALSNTMRTTATTTTVVPVTQSVTLTLVLNSKSPVRHGISGASGATSRWA